MWEQIEFALHASLARVLTKVATLLPAVLSLVLAVLVCGLLGLFLGYLLRRILVAVDFDSRVKANSPAGLLHWSPMQVPSLMLSRIVFWCGIFLGLVLGIAAFGAAYSPSEQTATEIYPYLTRIVTAILAPARRDGDRAVSGAERADRRGEHEPDSTRGCSARGSSGWSSC